MTWIDWVTIFELPALAGLLWWLQSSHRRGDDMYMRFLEMHTAHRLDVAKNYVTITHLKDVEHRLIDHLRRIERKIATEKKGCP